jgi:hypothetical protein
MKPEMYIVDVLFLQTGFPREFIPHCGTGMTGEWCFVIPDGVYRALRCKESSVEVLKCCIAGRPKKIPPLPFATLRVGRNDRSGLVRHPAEERREICLVGGLE